MKVLNIKNSDPYLNSKFVNIVDFSSKKLSAWDVGIKDFCIHYIEYDDHVFYLVLDNLKGFNRHFTKLFFNIATFDRTQLKFMVIIFKNVHRIIYFVNKL